MTVQVGTRSQIRVVARERRVGSIVRNAGVVVTNVGTGTAATVYSDEDLTTPISSLVTDGSGVFSFYAPPGTYSISFTGSDAFEAVENIHVVGDDTSPTGTYAATPIPDLGWDYDGRTVKVPSPATLTPTISDAGSLATEFLPVGLGHAKELYGKRNGSWLVKATDETTTPITWSSNSSGYHNFPHGIDALLATDDGEVLVAVRGTVQANPGGPGTVDYAKLYKSSGWNFGAGAATATWSVKLTSGHGYNNFLQRCLVVHGKIVIASTYGPTVTTRGLSMANDGPPKEVWLSTDYGATFTLIFDLWAQNVDRLGGGTDTTNDHTHGVTFNPKRRRITVTNGDTNDGVWQSDDLGKTWKFIADEQPTVVIAAARGEMFTSDHSPNGIYRLPDYSPDEDPAKKFIKPAYAIDNSGTGTVIGIAATRGSVDVYFGFSVSSQATDGSRIIGTADGETFYPLWHDATTYTNGGIEQIVGPTAAGYIHWYLDPDSRYTPNKTYCKALAPTWGAGNVTDAGALHLAGVETVTEPGNKQYTALASDPAAPATGKGKLYPRTVAGREAWHQLASSGAAVPFGPEQFAHTWCLVTPQSGTSLRTGGIGGAAGTAGTVSHPGISTHGYLAQLASAVSANAVADVALANTIVRRGTVGDEAGGFLLHAYCYFPDGSYDNTGASTGSRVGVGISGSGPATVLAADTGAGATAAFIRSHVNGGAIHTTWQFVTINGGSPTVVDTTLAFVAGHAYAFTIWCPLGSTTIYWRIKDVTTGTAMEGSATGTLPAATAGLNGFLGVLTVDAVARNIQFRDLYVRSDV